MGLLKNKTKKNFKKMKNATNITNKKFKKINKKLNKKRFRTTYKRKKRKKKISKKTLKIHYNAMKLNKLINRVRKKVMKNMAKHKYMKGGAKVTLAEWFDAINNVHIKGNTYKFNFDFGYFLSGDYLTTTVEYFLKRHIDEFDTIQTMILNAVRSHTESSSSTSSSGGIDELQGKINYLKRTYNSMVTEKEKLKNRTDILKYEKKKLNLKYPDKINLIRLWSGQVDILNTKIYGKLAELEEMEERKIDIMILPEEKKNEETQKELETLGESILGLQRRIEQEHEQFSTTWLEESEKLIDEAVSLDGRLASTQSVDEKRREQLRSFTEGGMKRATRPSPINTSLGASDEYKPDTPPSGDEDSPTPPSDSAVAGQAESIVRPAAIPTPQVRQTYASNPFGEFFNVNNSEKLPQVQGDVVSEQAVASEDIDIDVGEERGSETKGQQGSTLTALYDFYSEDDDELGFKKDDQITLVSIDGDWGIGFLLSQNESEAKMFPLNHTSYKETINPPPRGENIIPPERPLFDTILSSLITHDSELYSSAKHWFELSEISDSNPLKRGMCYYFDMQTEKQKCERAGIIEKKCKNVKYSRDILGTHYFIWNGDEVQSVDKKNMKPPFTERRQKYSKWIKVPTIHDEIIIKWSLFYALVVICLGKELTIDTAILFKVFFDFMVGDDLFLYGADENLLPWFFVLIENDFYTCSSIFEKIKKSGFLRREHVTKDLKELFFSYGEHGKEIKAQSKILYQGIFNSTERNKMTSNYKRWILPVAHMVTPKFLKESEYSFAMKLNPYIVNDRSRHKKYKKLFYSMKKHCKLHDKKRKKEKRSKEMKSDAPVTSDTKSDTSDVTETSKVPETLTMGSDLDEPEDSEHERYDDDFVNQVAQEELETKEGKNEPITPEVSGDVEQIPRSTQQGDEQKRKDLKTVKQLNTVERREDEEVSMTEINEEWKIVKVWDPNTKTYYKGMWSEKYKKLYHDKNTEIQNPIHEAWEEPAQNNGHFFFSNPQHQRKATRPEQRKCQIKKGQTLQDAVQQWYTQNSGFSIHQGATLMWMTMPTAMASIKDFYKGKEMVKKSINPTSETDPIAGDSTKDEIDSKIHSDDEESSSESDSESESESDSEDESESDSEDESDDDGTGGKTHAQLKDINEQGKNRDKFVKAHTFSISASALPSAGNENLKPLSKAMEGKE